MGADLSLALNAQPTDHICADCGKPIMFGQECWLIQIVQLHAHGDQIIHYPVIDPEDPNGDYLYYPFFFCFECWENNYKAIRDEVVDEPPLEDVTGTAQFECVICGSDICPGEYSGSFTLGEFQLSSRAPNGIRGGRFIPNAEPEAFCIYCVSMMNEYFIELWEGGVRQFGQCIECSQVRCWRYGDCACSCGCHLGEDPEEEEEEANG